MTEADVKRAMSQSIKDAGGYARRIEDTYSVGMFDMLIIPKGLPAFMAEVKMVPNNYFGPTPRQHIELVRIETVANGRGHVYPVMIGYKDGVYYFHRPQICIDYRECFHTDSKLSFHDQLVKYYNHLKDQK